MPLYVADYRADTAHLSAAEHGAYLLLIMHYWSTGSLPDDDRQLARIACMAPTEWKRARPTIAAFFHDGWKHGRIDEELKRAEEVAASYAARASQAAKTRWSKHASSNAPSTTSSNATGMLENAQPPSPSHKKDIAADAASTGNGKHYAFHDGIIRLTEQDFNKWEQAFSHLDLRSELMSLSKWAAEDQGDNWFHAVKGALAKRNRQAKERAENVARGGQLPLTASGNKWPDGIV